MDSWSGAPLGVVGHSKSVCGVNTATPPSRTELKLPTLINVQFKTKQNKKTASTYHLIRTSSSGIHIKYTQHLTPLSRYTNFTGTTSFSGSTVIYSHTRPTAQSKAACEMGRQRLTILKRVSGLALLKREGVSACGRLRLRPFHRRGHEKPGCRLENVTSVSPGRRRRMASVGVVC